MVIYTLMSVDVELQTESENWNFLKYGRIGKHAIPKVLPYLVIGSSTLNNAHDPQTVYSIR